MNSAIWCNKVSRLMYFLVVCLPSSYCTLAWTLW
uniref:Uncharacterized protein n=1 Tax=Setaria italica TaxID=4555 RepID=K3Z166_SETIT